LLRTIREAPNALIWAGLTTLTVIPSAPRYSASASQYTPVASMQACTVVAPCFSSHALNALKPVGLFSTTLFFSRPSANRNEQSSFAFATSIPGCMHYPLVIYLVNAGCRQAGPKILSDLSARVSDRCKNLRYRFQTEGRKRHPVARS
jgi:hypothetical protein